jgi:hypothetical protein
VVVAVNRDAKSASLRLPEIADGPAEVLFGEARWTPAPDGPSLDIPAETAAVLRLAP